MSVRLLNRPTFARLVASITGADQGPGDASEIAAPARPRRRRRPTDASSPIANELVQGYVAEGLSLRELAARHGLDKSAVTRALKKAGVTLRPRGRRTRQER